MNEDNVFKVQENLYKEVEETEAVVIYSNTAARPPGKPCPPGHYRGKGHYVGDNCNCDGGITPSVSIDMYVPYIVILVIVIIAGIAVKRYKKL